MTMVRIKEHLKDPVVDLWRYDAEYEDPENHGEYVGKIVNAIQFHDVRVQIKEQKLTGYKVYYKGVLIPINANGKLDRPKGLYDQIDDLLTKLI